MSVPASEEWTVDPVHVINDERSTFDRRGYATRTRCGIRFRTHPDTASVWPDEKKRGYVLAMDRRLTIPRKTAWCRECLT